MKRTYKNVYGDGRVEYVEYEVTEATEDDAEVTPEEVLAAMEGIA